MENNNGRIDDTYVIKFFRDKLKSMACQNQGFLLDGYPKTNEQAKELFARKFVLPKVYNDRSKCVTNII